MITPLLREKIQDEAVEERHLAPPVHIHATSCRGCCNNRRNWMITPLLPRRYKMKRLKHHLTPQAVSTSHLADDAVTTEKLADHTVTAEKIQDEAVEERHLTPQSISTLHLADGAVTREKLEDQTVTAEKLQDEAVEEQHVTSVHFHAASRRRCRRPQRNWMITPLPRRSCKMKQSRSGILHLSPFPRFISPTVP